MKPGLFRISLVLSVLFAQCVPTRGASPSGAPTVGMEGVLEVIVRADDLMAKPVDKAAPVIVRVADRRPHGSQTAYELRYVGQVPGRFDLRAFLAREKGGAMDDLPEMWVEVDGLLPEDHQGELVGQSSSLVSLFGGYRVLMGAAALVWLALMYPLFFAGRKNEPEDDPSEQKKEPTLADRLLPLVTAASENKLSGDEQARLERMLLGYWQRKLKLGDLDPRESMRRLKADENAGALLRELENWLHRPPGSAKPDVEAALRPYRNLPADDPDLDLDDGDDRESV